MSKKFANNIINNYEKGLEYLELGKIEKWIYAWEKEIEKLTTAGLIKETIDLLMEMGIIFYKFNEFNRAYDYFIQALKNCKKIKDQIVLAEILHYIGLIHTHWGDYKKAIKNYQQVQKIYYELNDKRGVGTILHAIGEIYLNWNEFNKALDCYQQALDIFRKFNYKIGEGETLHNIGLIYDSKHHYKEALDYFQQALTIHKENNYRIGIGRSLHNIGNIYDYWGENVKALNYFQQASTIYKALNDKKEESIALHSIGLIYYNWGKYDESLDYYKQSLAIKRKTNDRKGQSQTLENIGSLYYNRGEYKDAIDYYQQAKKIYIDLDDKNSEAGSLINIGNVFESWGEYNKAIENFKESLTIYENLEDIKGIYSALHNIGLLYMSWSRYDRALDYFQQALIITKEIEDKKGESIVLNNIGRIYYNRGKYDESLDYYKQSLAIKRQIIDKKGVGHTLLDIGSLYTQWRQYEEALDYFQQSLEISEKLKDKKGKSEALLSIGNIYFHRDEYDEAQEYYQKSLEICEECNNIKGKASTLNNIGIIHTLHSQFSEAIKCFKTSFTIEDQLASLAPNSNIRITARITQLKTLSPLILCFLWDHKPDLAFTYLEFSKAREMFLHRSSEEFKIDSLLVELKDRINEIEEKLQQLVKNEVKDKNVEKEKSSLLRIRNQLNQDIEFNFSTKGTTLPKDPSDFINSFKSEMISKWIILDFHYDPITEHLVVFCLQRDNELLVFDHSLKKIKLDQLNKTALGIIELRREDVQKAEERLLTLGKVLYCLFIPEELQDYLFQMEFNFLTIIPTGTMHAFPLELIHDGDNYWGLKYALTRAFNLQTLRAAISSRDKKQKLSALIIGDPTAGIENLGLEQTIKEAENLKNLLKRIGVEAKSLIKEEAEETKILHLLRTEPFTLIHFAGHAFFDSDNPDLSHLVVRSGNKAKKLYGNKIPIETTLSGNPLVVLSACETGGTETYIGDEVFGLARGFIEAGASGMLIAGWNLPSDSSIDFFNVFYKYYLEMNCSLAEAIRLARLYVRKIALSSEEAKEGEPFYVMSDCELLHWSPYRFYGLPY